MCILCFQWYKIWLEASNPNEFIRELCFQAFQKCFQGCFQSSKCTSLYTGVWNTGYIIYITINIYLFIYYLNNMYIFACSWWFILSNCKSRNICIFACSASLLKESKVILNAVFDFNYEAFMTRVSNTRVQIEIAFAVYDFWNSMLIFAAILDQKGVREKNVLKLSSYIVCSA